MNEKQEFPMEQVITKAFQKIEHLYSEKNSDPLYIKNPFEYFAKKLSHFSPSDLIIVNGNSGSGRLPFVLNMLYRLTVNEKIPSGIIHFDKTDVELCNMIMSIGIGGAVLHSKIESGDLDDEDWYHLYDVAEKLSSSPLNIYEIDGINIDELRNKCRYLKETQDIKILIIGPINRLLSLNEFTHEGYYGVLIFLKKIARELNIPIIAINNAIVDGLPDYEKLASGKKYLSETDILLSLYRPNALETLNKEWEELSYENLFVEIEINKRGKAGKEMFFFNSEYFSMFESKVLLEDEFTE